MNPQDVVFALGALDPEMRAIRYLLRKTGFRCAFANRFGRRCTSGNAYKADELTKIVRNEQQIVWVECRTTAFDAERDLIVDHHNVGDPGYDAPANEFWDGSSIGQVAKLVGGSKDEFKLVAASDHCLSAAMRGVCQGIDPSALMAWRIMARSAMAEIQPWFLRRRIERAVGRIETLPRLNFGGEQIVDASFDTTPELRDAAALSRVPILMTRTNPVGQLKVSLYGAQPDVVVEWMAVMKSSGVVEHLYGNPFREYAGALLNAEVSDRMLSANRASRAH
ncbi:hypothetical protein [Pseudomonas sp. MWU12-2323]|uniref:hypothetical protein n=1 Tax=Pseudomonas sp. MWU12-2323 TaxID=2651296 RepID=UPI00128E756A|nr:hypothetical protein [Pseudomonas sp. MWU12-2323]MPQ71529.1 hypothetical protein [Pseudomonas sp. MWU12-2323]